MVMELSLVLPGYNEEEGMDAAVRRCVSALTLLGVSYEIIVVDDGSTDRTAEIADRLAAEFQAVRVIHNPVNLNVGASLLIGMRAARGRIITHNSFDLPFAPEDLESILLPLRSDDADVVVAVRTDRSAHSPWRKATSLTHHWLVRMLFAVGIRDLNFVQAYRRDRLDVLKVRSRSPAFVTPELIIRAKASGCRIVEVAAPFHPRQSGRANFGKPRDILWTFADMVSFKLEMKAGGRTPALDERDRGASIR